MRRDDFETAATGWSATARTSCGTANILGGYGTTTTSLARTYDLTGIAHAEVKVVLDYYAIDSWDNELPHVVGSGSNANKIWKGPSILYSDVGRLHVCGNASYGEAVYTATAMGSHPGNSVTVTAGANLDSPGADESFGIDNVEIWVR